MYGAPGEFGSDSCSEKLPGAIFHDRREPEGQPTGKWAVISVERYKILEVTRIIT
jgi:hypothetical protein